MNQKERPSLKKLYRVYSEYSQVCLSHLLCLTDIDVVILGVRGRVVDLCKPTQRKYETAVSVILGRNIDAVVVDEEKTAIDCIEVKPCLGKCLLIHLYNRSTFFSTCAINVLARRLSFH
jgi:hypothetical protein